MRVFSSDQAAFNALNNIDLQIDLWNWRDGLQVGPVSLEWDLDRFSEERTFYLGSLGWDTDGTLEADFKLRNGALAAAISSDEPIALIFSENPRDQLQLTQIVSWMLLRSPGSLEKTSIFAEVSSFLQTVGDTGECEPVGVSLEEAEGRLLAWMAFVSPDPRLMERQASVSALAPVRELMARLLWELPSSENGLSLTECQILDAVALGVARPKDLFEAVSQAENRVLYNDWEFWALLEGMFLGAQPLLEIDDRGSFLRPPLELAWTDFEGQQFRLTDGGKRILNRQEGDWGALGERWLGGTKIDAESVWRWDYGNGRLLAVG